MRKWNVLNIYDKVLYNNIEYLVIDLYEKDNKRLCDLTSTDKSNTKLKGVSICECIRLKD